MTQDPGSLVESFRIFLSRRYILQSAALLAFLLFMIGAFRPGWKQATTDFPNYYTAAVLTKQHQPLRNYYDWTWFAKQMNVAGNGMQIGAYSPQTPLTMLPFMPLAGFQPQTAKRIWLACNLAFLAMTVLLLSRITGFRFETVWLLAFCGYFSLQSNFFLGQYYVFVLFLLTLAVYCLHSKKHWASGCIAGIAFGLKLYGGPFMLCFVRRRQWKSLLGMGAAMLLLVGLAIALFGRTDVLYYATQILPRSLDTAPVDPYHPANSTYSAFLMRSLVADPELNPHPLWQNPGLYFFLRSFISLTIVVFLFLGAGRARTTERHDFAWFVIGAVLLSTTASSYTFIILLLPFVLLLEDAGPVRSFLLVASYIFLASPLHAAWLFPKVWVLLASFLAIGWPCWREIPRRHVLAAFSIVALISAFIARQQLTNRELEPGQRFEHFAVQAGELFSSFPVVSRAGVFCQSMGKDRYVLRWFHDGQSQQFVFPGQALYPRLAPDGASIDFELAANRTSTMMRFDPSTASTKPLAIAVPAYSAASAESPDKKWLAFESAQDGPTHIWLRDLSNGQQRRLTGGNCNSSSPAWESDSKAILFASDCGRGFGLPTLYRAPINVADDQRDSE